MNSFGDLPQIARTEQTGYPEDEKYPLCPICGLEASTFYTRDMEIVGCENCIEKTDAWEHMEEME